MSLSLILLSTVLRMLVRRAATPGSVRCVLDAGHTEVKPGASLSAVTHHEPSDVLRALRLPAR